MDIAPTLDMYAATDMAFATAHYHWFHLIQPSFIPEALPLEPAHALAQFFGSATPVRKGVPAHIP